jgi:hypothetical protein
MFLQFCKTFIHRFDSDRRLQNLVFSTTYEQPKATLLVHADFGEKPLPVDSHSDLPSK